VVRPALGPGSLVGGRYAVESLIASGGMGQVYAARDAQLQRLVAVKVLSCAAPDAQALARFDVEAKATARLQHPGILAVLDAGADEGRPWLVCELLEGHTLRELLADGPLPVRRAIELGLQLAKALAAAHRAQIVHRDLKPGNLFVTAAGDLKILDFGVAKLMPAEAGGAALTDHGQPIGTVPYMAPEQIRCEAVDERADVFAFGAVLYEVLTGRRAFDGPSRVEAGYAVLTAAPPPLPDELPPSLRHAVERCLRKRKEERFASAAEIADALEAALAEVGSAGPHLPWRRSLRVAAAVVAALGAALGISLAGQRFTRSRVGSPRLATAPRVAVLPFKVLGSPSLQWLGEGMVDLLASGLEAGGARLVDPSAVVRRARDGVGELSTSRELAQALGADLFVAGTIIQSDSDVRLHARVHAVDGPATALAEATVEGPADDLARVVSRLAKRLRSQLGGALEPPAGPGGRMGRLGEQSTRSPAALKSYLEGEAILRRGRWADAVDALRAALAHDPQFALAHYRLAVAANTEQPGVADEALAQALRLAEKLAPRDRALLEAYAAFREGRSGEAEQRYRQILAAHADDVEAWVQLGEVLIHYNSLRGRSPAEAEEAFSHALVLDPLNGQALMHRIDIAVAQGETQVSLALAERGISAQGESSDETIPLQWVRAWATADDAGRARAVARAASSSSPRLLHEIFFRSLWADPGLAAAQAVAEAMRAADLPLRLQGIDALAALELARGRPSAARSLLAQAAALAPKDTFAHRAAAIAALPFVPLTPGELQRALEEAQALDEPTPRHAALKHSALGLIAARAREVERAERSAAALERLGPEMAAGSAGADLALAVRATLEDALGKPAAALALLERMVLRIPYRQHALYLRVPQQLLRARLLAASGHEQDALRIAGSFGYFNEQAPAYVVPSLLLRAGILERRGEREQAAALRREAAVLWRHAEPQMRAQLTPP
jgi:tetratricopeptide (TPR) repeat protein